MKRKNKPEEIVLEIPWQSNLEELVNESIDNNSKAILEYKAGIMSSLDKIVSDVVKKSGGKADPRKVRNMILMKL